MQIEQVLFTANTWAFDAYALEEAAHGHPLSVLGFWVLQSTGLMAWAHMDVHKLIRFLQRVEQGYSSDNPYHNKRHAADVLQSMHVIMHRGGMAPGYVDQPTMLAAYLAAIVHDYEHRGRNNDYLINVYDELALRYNDRSPMENHHLAAAFGLLRDPELDCLSKLPKTTFNKIRKIMIEMVLATEWVQCKACCRKEPCKHSMPPCRVAALPQHACNEQHWWHVIACRPAHLPRTCCNAFMCVLVMLHMLAA